MNNNNAIIKTIIKSVDRSCAKLVMKQLLLLNFFSHKYTDRRDDHDTSNLHYLSTNTRSKDLYFTNTKIYVGK